MRTWVLGFLIIFLSFAFDDSSGNGNCVHNYRGTSKSEKQDSYEVVFVRKFPNSEKEKNENWFSRLFSTEFPYRNRFSALIFGSELQNKLRPISVLATSPDSILMLDQANGVLIETFGDVGEITHFKENKNLKFPSLVNCCYAENKEVLFTDSKLNRVFKYNPVNDEVAYLNDSLLFNSPTGIAYSVVNEEIWIVETGAHRILVLDKNGNFIKYIGTRGTAAGEFNFPTFIWIDELGIVYVVDTMNFRIQLFDKTGQFLSFFGKPGDTPGSFARPKGIATDNLGHIYVADALFNNIQVFDRQGNLLTMFGKMGNADEEFWLPVGIFIDRQNYIYVADSYNSRVQVFKLNKKND